MHGVHMYSSFFLCVWALESILFLVESFHNVQQQTVSHQQSSGVIHHPVTQSANSVSGYRVYHQNQAIPQHTDNHGHSVNTIPHTQLVQNQNPVQHVQVQVPVAYTMNVVAGNNQYQTAANSVAGFQTAHDQTAQTVQAVHGQGHAQTAQTVQTVQSHQAVHGQGHHAPQQVQTIHHTQVNHAVFPPHSHSTIHEQQRQIPANQQTPVITYIYHPVTLSTHSHPGFQGTHDQTHHQQQQLQAHATYNTQLQGNQQLYQQIQQPPPYNQQHSGSSNPLPQTQPVQVQNYAQQVQIPVASGTNAMQTNNHYQTATNDMVTSTVTAQTSSNQFSSQHHSLPGASSTGHARHDNGGQTNQNSNAGRISQRRTHVHDPYNVDIPLRTVNVVVEDESNQVHAYSRKNVYVDSVPNNWMLYGIHNVIAYLHQFGCDLNDEQPMKLISNPGPGILGAMMILFQHEQQAREFIQCINTIAGKFDVNYNQENVFLNARFARTNTNESEIYYTKSLTGMYCDINQLHDLNLVDVQLMFKREIVACGIAKSIHEIEFEAPCSPTNHRINYKLASKQLRNQAVACLIKRNDICSAVGTW